MSRYTKPITSACCPLNSSMLELPLKALTQSRTLRSVEAIATCADAPDPWTALYVVLTPLVPTADAPSGLDGTTSPKISGKAIRHNIGQLTAPWLCPSWP